MLTGIGTTVRDYFKPEFSTYLKISYRHLSNGSLQNNQKAQLDFFERTRFFSRGTL